MQAGEEQLVDFLYNLGSGNSQIRVRDLTVRPDPPRQQLLAQVKLVASYQKRAAARPGARPGRTPAAHTAATASPAATALASADAADNSIH